MAKETGGSGKIDLMVLANASLEEIITSITPMVRKVDAGGEPGDGLPDKQVQADRVLLDLIEKITGFPQDTLKMEYRLLDDLNLDSIKAADLLSRASGTLQIESKAPDLSKYANASLSEITDVLQQLMPAEPGTGPQPGAVKEEAHFPTWVRDFSVAFVETPTHKQPEPPVEPDYPSMNALIIGDEDSMEIADTLMEKLVTENARGKTMTFTKFRDQGAEKAIGDTQYTHLYAVLPRKNKEDLTGAALLETIVARLSVLTSVPVNSQSGAMPVTLTYVQMGGGFFGQNPEYCRLEQCCAGALAKSLHLERSDLKIRVLDFCPSLEAGVISDTVLREIFTPGPFEAVGFDRDMTRRVMVQRALSRIDYSESDIKWSSEDVVLVTGGAKGITAASALETARKTGVRMALIGRSPHPGNKRDNEIARNLDLYREAGLEAGYYSCDVTDAAAAAAVIQKIETEMGPVTGIIHGAGLNVPRAVSGVSVEEALIEIGPKLSGLLNLLEGVDKEGLKIIVGMSSIIGITGMPGNAWYGFSNEALDIILRRFTVENPNTRTLAVAYSIWREEGMGARMGSVGHLKGMGIDAIPTAEGVEHFVRLFTHDAGVPQVIVTARLGGLDTMNPGTAEIPAGHRYPDQPVSVFPGVEAVYKTRLSLETDPYLKDHLFQGSYLFPTVFGLEAMAEVAAAAAGKNREQLLRIENIRLDRPITVEPVSDTEIIIHALVEEVKPGSEEVAVQAGIVKPDLGTVFDCFSALFIFGRLVEPSYKEIKLPPEPTSIAPALDLYRENHLFQGPSFQRIRKIHSLDPERSKPVQALFSTYVSAGEETAHSAFGENSRHEFYLGDPFSRDSLLQAALLVAPKETCLPVRIDSIEVFQTCFLHSFEALVEVIITGWENDEIQITVTSVDEEGRLVERLTGYTVKILSHHDEYPSLQDLLTPAERDLNILHSTLDPLAEKWDIERPLLAVEYPPGIKRLSPDERLYLSTAGSGGRCDCAFVPIESRSQWLEILGESSGDSFEHLLAAPDTPDRAASRVRAVKEAVKKVTGESPETVDIIAVDGDSVLFEHKQSSLKIVTVVLRLTWGPERFFAIASGARERQASGTAPDTRAVREEDSPFPGYAKLLDDPSFRIEMGHQGQLAFIQRIPVTFAPSSQVGSNVYFTNYIHWMGECREVSVWPVMKELSRGFLSGSAAAVTNFSRLTILGEATAGDIVEVWFWISENSGPYNSTMMLCYDFRRIVPGGEPVRLAYCRLQTTWAEIVRHGVVKSSPYPKFYDEFLKSMSTVDNASDIPKPLPEPLKELSDLEEKEVIYEVPPGPENSCLLMEKDFETTLFNGNLVGNIYYANYYDWQAHIRDAYFYGLIPGHYTGRGKDGELICLEAGVDHLRETMPFDRVRVKLSLEKYYEEYAILRFDYFKIEEGDQLLKVAQGDQKVVWIKRSEDGAPYVAAFPSPVKEAFEKASRA
ncbi:MAG: SDR family NAD(P)-dependent oxidoreductase [bacterium]|nr:SDR family NAD(P)-dependent oxidoreductase [bacterium]